MAHEFFRITRVKLALLLPGAGFLLLELILEPAALKLALPGLIIWGLLYYVAASVAVTLRSRRAHLPRFRLLLGYAVLLATLDQLLKFIVLHRLPLEQEQTLIPAALTLTHTHNLQGSWVAAQFGLDFIGDTFLITLSLFFTLLAISLYRYYVDRRGQPNLWTATAMVGFVAGFSSAFVELALRGYTVDYLGFAGLVVADLKDFYLDIAIAAFFAEFVENYDAARRMSSKETFLHVTGALALSAQEIEALFRRKRQIP